MRPASHLVESVEAGKDKPVRRKAIVLSFGLEVQHLPANIPDRRLSVDFTKTTFSEVTSLWFSLCPDAKKLLGTTRSFSLYAGAYSAKGNEKEKGERDQEKKRKREKQKTRKTKKKNTKKIAIKAQSENNNASFHQATVDSSFVVTLLFSLSFSPGGVTSISVWINGMYGAPIDPIKPFTET